MSDKNNEESLPSPEVADNVQESRQPRADHEAKKDPALSSGRLPKAATLYFSPAHALTTRLRLDTQLQQKHSYTTLKYQRKRKARMDELDTIGILMDGVSISHPSTQRVLFPPPQSAETLPHLVQLFSN